ncbi:MAG: glycosyl hydrolase [Solirubrobacteraceae bacterium]|nr:glycosyl hydrolase [Solirubrobacteraceae bacterium]
MPALFHARRRRSALLTLLACLAGVLLTAATPATAATQYGMSDGRPALFDSEKLHEVDFRNVRLVLPWNAAYEHGSWERWIERAQLQGFPVLIAPSIDKARNCETGTCSGPSVAQYTAAIGALLARYPGIDAIEAWNEPNHAVQPTSRSAAAAAAFHDAAKGLCEGGRCTVVAGNLLDGPSMAAYLARYRAALKTRPDVWGVHNYFDATYFDSDGVDRTLATGNTPVWLTETGGLVTFRSPTSTLPYDERRAADSVRWIFGLVRRSPRIERVYFYGMWQQPTNPFDSALLRVDNAERPSMSMVRDGIGLRTVKLPGIQAPELIDPVTGTFPGADGAGTGGAGGAPAGDEGDGSSSGGLGGLGGLDGSTGTEGDGTRRDGTAADSRRGGAGDGGRSDGSGASSAPGALRVIGKRLRVGADRRLVVRLRCVGTVDCRGSYAVAVGPWRLRREVEVRPGGQFTARWMVPRGVVRSLKAGRIRERWVRACDHGAVCSVAPRTTVIAASA